MPHDVAYEAQFLRAALLVGFVHERDVPRWAEALIHDGSPHTPALTDVLLARVELTAMREALRPLADEAGEAKGVMALLVALAVDARTSERSSRDYLRMLGLMRREYALPAEVAEGIKSMEDRTMLADAGVAGEFGTTLEELRSWFRQHTDDAFFHVITSRSTEAAAFVAALARRSTPPDELGDGPRCWCARQDPRVVKLNEPAWRLAMHHFSPLPLASRIPHGPPRQDDILLLHGRHAEPLGMDDVMQRLTALNAS
ncbi:MAG: hypothetical protein U0132_03935 [Gemmatimonadaceae bacterium]